MSVDEGNTQSYPSNNGQIDEKKSSRSETERIIDILLVEDKTVNQRMIARAILSANASLPLRIFVVDNMADAIAAVAKQKFTAFKAHKDRTRFHKERRFDKISFDVVFMDKQILDNKISKKIDDFGGLKATKAMRELGFKGPIYSISSVKLEPDEVEKYGYTADLTKSAHDLMREKVEAIKV